MYAVWQEAFRGWLCRSSALKRTAANAVEAKSADCVRQFPAQRNDGKLCQNAAAPACSKQPQATDPPFIGEQDNQAGQAFGVCMRAVNRQHGAENRQLSAALSVAVAITCSLAQRASISCM